MAYKQQVKSSEASNGDSLSQEVKSLRSIVNDLRESVGFLEIEKDNLRQAVRKLKAENLRTKDKLKKLSEHLKHSVGEAVSDDDEFPEYDEIGRDFILIGGSHDPLDIRYEALIKDKDGVEHATSERYYWTKMAEHFKDDDARTKILEAGSTPKAEEAMREIKNFNEKEWDKIKMQVWEDGQRLKFEQHRRIANVLIETGAVYIAVCHHDKQIGTGWRKSRVESNRPVFWNGQNEGGKFLMRLRKTLTADHTWEENEQKETQNRLKELKRYVWRRLENHGNNGFRTGMSSTRPGRGGMRGGGSRQFTKNHSSGTAEKRALVSSDSNDSK